MNALKGFLVLAVGAVLAWPAGVADAAGKSLLNASYDPTRELYQDIDAAFCADWKAKTGQELAIQQSHDGSGKQARAVIDGLDADVVSLALSYDIDMIAEKARLLPKDWSRRLPGNSAPFTSTVVFLVRQGNPKGIKDWEDLAKPGVAVVTPNPKTSGGARWNYLAAWGAALKRYGGDQVKAREFVSRLYKNVPVLDSGARGATTTFVERGIGDVLIAWESEAMLAQQQLGAGRVQVVVPTASILAETPVALVDGVVDRKGTRREAQAFLEFLYTAPAQELAAKRFYRPRDAAVAQKYAAQFSKLELFTIDLFGGWATAQQAHFADGGIFDHIYQPGVSGL